MQKALGCCEYWLFFVFLVVWVFFWLYVADKTIIIFWLWVSADPIEVNDKLSISSDEGLGLIKAIIHPYIKYFLDSCI